VYGLLSVLIIKSNFSWSLLFLNKKNEEEISHVLTDICKIAKKLEDYLNEKETKKKIAEVNVKGVDSQIYQTFT